MLNTIIHISKGEAERLAIDAYGDGIDQEGNLFATMLIRPDKGEIKLSGGFVPLKYAVRIQAILMEMQGITEDKLPKTAVSGIVSSLN